jgi:tRNA1(Val) A37 N6-methylase TrmN6
MRSILETTDPVLVSYVEALLKEAGIVLHVADVNMSIVEGSIGIFPRRVLVGDDDAETARRILADAGLAGWLAGDRQAPRLEEHTVARVRGEEMTADVTDDVFLGGRLNILQPRKGYRAGLDAVLLAASTPVHAGAGECVLDAGAGVGVVGLSVAARIEDARVTLVEVEPELADLAKKNAERNDLSHRVAIVQADVAAGGSAFNAADGGAGLRQGAFAHALANPPYLAAGRGTEPPDRLKAGAHQMDDGELDAWVRFLATALASGGSATLIHRADALGALLGAMEGRFGSLKVFPVFPRAGEAASRVIVQGLKGSRAPLTLLPGLVLHDTGHAFRPEVEAILRHGAALELGS